MPSVACPRCSRPAAVNFFDADHVFTCPACGARFYPRRPGDPVPDEPQAQVPGVPRRLTWAWIRPHLPWLSAGLGVCLVFLTAAVITVTSWSPDEEALAKGGKRGRRRLNADELNQLVIGQPKAKVMRLIGRPNRVYTYGGEDEESLEYYGLVYDPATNKRMTASVRIEGGVASRVDYP
jgi:hypothetical protein